MVDTPEGVEVPHDRLAPDTLQRLVEEFVTRDGTDYGPVERTRQQKVAAVLLLLDRGEARVVFDPETGTTTIVPARARPR